MDWRELFSRYRFQIVFFGVGVGLFLYGVWQMKAASVAGEVVVAEVPMMEEPVSLVIVDVAGAVMHPGVYELPTEARIGEALALAGGLAEDADETYVASRLNQAEKVRDGMKLFVPREGDVVSGSVGEVAGASDSGGGVVRINHASASELETLWGIGEARAAAIVENRPYASLDEMAERAKIPTNVMERNEGAWVVD